MFRLKHYRPDGTEIMVEVFNSFQEAEDQQIAEWRTMSGQERLKLVFDVHAR